MAWRVVVETPSRRTICHFVNRVHSHSPIQSLDSFKDSNQCFQFYSKVVYLFKWLVRSSPFRVSTTRDNGKMATQQRLPLYFKNFARKKIQSKSTVVEISRSRSPFEALKTLRFKKCVSKSKKFRERLKSINFDHNMCNNSLQFH